MSTVANKIKFKISTSARQNRNRFIKWIGIGIVLSIIMEIFSILSTFVWWGKLYDESEVQTVSGYVKSIDHEFYTNLHLMNFVSYTFVLSDGKSYEVNEDSVTEIAKDITEGDWVTITYVPNSYNSVRGISSENRVYFTLNDYNQYHAKYQLLGFLMFNFILITPIWMIIILKFYPHEYVAVKRRHKEKLKKLQSKRK